ncbi:MAG: glycosyltransferase family 4 protein [Hahellaceae bacterium]|nr:glycosyltransferase family 4 protein [Hahellaceae bacterium]
MVVVFTFIAGWLGVVAYRRYAMSAAILDVPNSRSSHVNPTPRGAGLIFVVLSVGVWGGLSVGGYIEWSYAAPFLLSLVLTAGVGFYDDLAGASPLLRLAVQTIAVIISLLAFPSLPEIQWFGWSTPWPPVVFSILLLTLVWLVNLFNFMDGIDGIAGVETVSVLGGGILLLLVGDGEAYALYPLVLMAAVAGFLMLNWPPAKVFMGDVGSGFLGLAIGLIAIISAIETQVNLWCWLILMSVFIADATMTLMRRIFRGQRFYEAHRSHAYQRLSRRWNSHAKVTGLLLAFNLLVLFPLAMMVMYWPQSGAAIFILTLGGLMAGAWRCGAGTCDN